MGIAVFLFWLFQEGRCRLLIFPKWCTRIPGLKLCRRMPRQPTRRRKLSRIKPRQLLTKLRQTRPPPTKSLPQLPAVALLPAVAKSRAVGPLAAVLLAAVPLAAVPLAAVPLAAVPLAAVHPVAMGCLFFRVLRRTLFLPAAQGRPVPVPGALLLVALSAGLMAQTG